MGLKVGLIALVLGPGNCSIKLVVHDYGQASIRVVKLSVASRCPSGETTPARVIGDLGSSPAGQAAVAG